MANELFFGRCIIKVYPQLPDSLSIETRPTNMPGSASDIVFSYLRNVFSFHMLMACQYPILWYIYTYIYIYIYIILLFFQLMPIYNNAIYKNACCMISARCLFCQQLTNCQVSSSKNVVVHLLWVIMMNSILTKTWLKSQTCPVRPSVGGLLWRILLYAFPVFAHWYVYCARFFLFKVLIYTLISAPVFGYGQFLIL